MPDEPRHADRQFWRLSPAQVCTTLDCSLDGLNQTEAKARLERYGPNSDAPSRAVGPLRAVLRRLLEPLSLILLAAGIVSAADR